MGTLALESELDAAVRILDYRLSCAKSPEAQDIYKYCISLLSRKIQKTYKKSPSVVPPVSVSFNKYSILSVDSMDCSDSPVSISSSKGVPAKGSAPEAKSCVLNSLLDNIFSPSLASEEPESPAGTEEVSFLDLRRSFTMEHEVTIPIHIYGPLNTIEVGPHAPT